MRSPLCCIAPILMTSQKYHCSRRSSAFRMRELQESFMLQGNQAGWYDWHCKLKAISKHLVDFADTAFQVCREAFP